MVRLSVMTAISCTICLGLAIYPGALIEILFDSLIIAIFRPDIFVGGLFTLAVCTWFIPNSAPKKLLAVRFIHRQRPWIWIFGFVLTTAGAITFNLPQRMAFALCLTEWEELAEKTLADGSQVQKIHQRIGPYWIDHARIDSNGSVYFRTSSAAKPIFREDSYGFVRSPRHDGTPFGGEGFCLWHVRGKWFGFAGGQD